MRNTLLGLVLAVSLNTAAAQADQAAACLATDSFRQPEATIAACGQAAEASAGTAQQRARVFARRGEAYYWGGNAGAAIEPLTAAIALDPADDNAQLLRAWAYRHLNLMDKALDDAKAVNSRSPNNARAIFTLASFTESGEHIDATIAAFEKAIAIDPKYYLARVGLSRIFFNYFGDAKRSLEINDALVKEGDAALNTTRFFVKEHQSKDFANLVHLARGQDLQQLGRYRESYDEFKTVIAHEPENAAAHSGLAFTLNVLRRYEEAMAEADLAIGFHSVCQCDLQTKVDSLGHLGCHAEVIPLTEKILSGPLGSRYAAARALFSRGAALKALGEAERAKQDFESAIGLSDWARRAVLTQLRQAGFYAGSMDDPYSPEMRNALEACMIDDGCMI